MAIAYDTASQVGSSPTWTSVSGGGVSQLTIPTFPTSGTERCVFVISGNSAGGAQRTTSSVVRGGSETFTPDWTRNQGSFSNCSGGHYVNPATATATVVVTFSGTCDECGAGAVGLNGVDPTAPVGTAVVNSNVGTTSTVTVSPGVDDWIVDGVYILQTTLTVGADQTSRFEQESIAGGTALGSSTQLGSAGGVMTWTFSSENWTAGAIPVKPYIAVPTYLGTPKLALQQRMG